MNTTRTSSAIERHAAVMPQGAIDRARAAWGDALPDWVAELAGACDASSQSRVARRIGYSASVISQVLTRTYRGSLATVEQKVRGALMRETIECPVMGELSRDRCIDNQRLAARGVIATSSMRSRLYHACRRCHHSRMKGK